MCGKNSACLSKRQTTVVTVQNGAGDCNNKQCSWDYKTSSCKSQRGPEVCELITKYYNPLYVGGNTDTNGNPLDFSCEDGKGKHVGTYQCLGNVKNIV